MSVPMAQKTRAGGAWALALTTAVTACQSDRPPPAAPLTVRELATPARPGSGEPNLTAAPDGTVRLSWVEPREGGGHGLRFAALSPDGAWSEPRTVAFGPDWFVNWADFPSLAALPDGTLFAHWLARSGTGKYAYDVRIAASRDGGRTWGPPATPHRDGTPTEHGFVSLVPWTGGRMGVVWLDGRETAQAGSAAAMTLRFASLDAGGRLADEALLDERVCDCCQTGAAAAEGALLVAYRDRSAHEVRDVAVVRFAGGRWSEPVILGPDGWTIDGCPVNGPAVDARGRRAAVAWFAAPGERGHVRAALSADAGATWSAPVAVDDGRPLGRVDVAVLDGGGALVSWLERTERGAEVRLRRLGPGGEREAALVVAAASEARGSGFPRLERAGAGTVVAWRDAGEPSRVRTALVELGPVAEAAQPRQ
jgi:hypothetical protein